MSDGFESAEYNCRRCEAFFIVFNPDMGDWTPTCPTCDAPLRR